jgi:hypothetical protein
MVRRSVHRRGGAHRVCCQICCQLPWTDRECAVGVRWGSLGGACDLASRGADAHAWRRAATLRAGLAAMIGVIALAILVCLLVLALVLFVPRRRRRAQGWEPRSEKPEHIGTPSGAAGSTETHVSGESERDR